MEYISSKDRLATRYQEKLMIINLRHRDNGMSQEEKESEIIRIHDEFIRALENKMICRVNVSDYNKLIINLINRCYMDAYSDFLITEKKVEHHIDIFL